MIASVSKFIIPVAAALTLAACSGGGNLSLVPRAPSSNTPGPVKGSPFVQVNQGGRALIVEQGKTASTGVHGWVAINSVASTALSSGAGGNTAVIMNKGAPNANAGRNLSSDEEDARK